MNGSTHEDEEIKNLMNKYNFLVINAQEDFSIEACTLNIFSQVLVLQHQVITIGFNYQNTPLEEEQQC